MNERDRWLNVAQAAQWLADGRAVDWRRPPPFDGVWRDFGRIDPLIGPECEYRLRPEPPKPREWVLMGYECQYPYAVSGPVIPDRERVRVREVL